MQKRKMATNRAAIGPIRAMLCAQTTMLLGYILGPARAPGVPNNDQKKPKHVFRKILKQIMVECVFASWLNTKTKTKPSGRTALPDRTRQRAESGALPRGGVEGGGAQTDPQGFG